MFSSLLFFCLVNLFAHIYWCTKCESQGKLLSLMLRLYLMISLWRKAAYLVIWKDVELCEFAPVSIWSWYMVFCLSCDLELLTLVCTLSVLREWPLMLKYHQRHLTHYFSLHSVLMLCIHSYIYLKWNPHKINSFYGNTNTVFYQHQWKTYFYKYFLKYLMKPYKRPAKQHRRKSLKPGWDDFKDGPFHNPLFIGFFLK